MTQTPRIEIKHHYSKLSPKETDELVGTVADLIVNFIKSGKHLKRGQTETAADPVASARGGDSKA